MGSGVDIVTCSGGADVADFKKKVKAENPNKLKNVDAGDLTIFEEKKDIYDRIYWNELEVDKAIQGLGNSKDNPLIVVVPTIKYSQRQPASGWFTIIGLPSIFDIANIKNYLVELSVWSQSSSQDMSHTFNPKSKHSSSRSELGISNQTTFSLNAIQPLVSPSFHLATL